MDFEPEPEAELDKQIDEVWLVFLERLKRKKVPLVRSEFGDELNLFVPQIRMLLPIYANPLFPKSIYTTSHLTASRNTYAIMRKLGMPPDYFWKFEFWMGTRAFDVLSKVTNKIFREILSTTKQGLLSVENVSTGPQEIKVILELEECAECFGVDANHPICYYHAGTLTGIISALVGKELEGYESSCCATGGNKCVFVIGEKSEALEKYLNPEKIELSLHTRLKNVLDGTNIRSIGNETDVRYYQLLILNSLITNPKIFSASNYELGVGYGKTLASFLQEYYNKTEEELFDMILEYYKFLKHLQIVTKEGTDEIRAKEVAEISGLSKNNAFLGFLFGELEGLLSGIRKEKVVYAGNTFENEELVIKFKREEGY
jgi:predicted hydrocarbon binding protein